MMNRKSSKDGKKTDSPLSQGGCVCPVVSPLSSSSPSHSVLCILYHFTTTARSLLPIYPSSLLPPLSATFPLFHSSPSPFPSKCVELWRNRKGGVRRSECWGFRAITELRKPHSANGEDRSVCSSHVLPGGEPYIKTTKLNDIMAKLDEATHMRETKMYCHAVCVYVCVVCVILVLITCNISVVSLRDNSQRGWDK